MPRDHLAAAARALTPIIADVAADPRNLKPGDLCRLLNSTPLGAVLDDRKLRGHRNRAGHRLGDGKTIDLFRYASWLHEQHSTAAAAPPEPPSDVLANLAAAVGVSVSMLHRWFKRGCPRGTVAEIRAWRADHVLPRQGGPRSGYADEEDTGDMQYELLVAKRDKEREQARAIKLKTDVLEGKLIERADVVREFAEQFACARAILDGFPDAFSKEAPAELRSAAYTLARSRMDGVLRLLAQLGSDDA